MHLELPVSANWTRTTSGDETLYAVAPSLTLSASPLTPLPLGLAGWGDRIVIGATPRERYRLTNLVETHTEGGWPVTIFSSDILAAADGPPVERRIHALYRFLEYGGVAVARSTTPATLDAHRDALMQLFLQARPDWRGPILTLAQLWEGLPPKGAPGSSEETP